jgi:hypothetical protein
MTARLESRNLAHNSEEQWLGTLTKFLFHLNDGWA